MAIARIMAKHGYRPVQEEEEGPGYWIGEVQDDGSESWFVSIWESDRAAIDYLTENRWRDADAVILAAADYATREWAAA